MSHIKEGIIEKELWINDVGRVVVLS